jgi:hypothetical protein
MNPNVKRRAVLGSGTDVMVRMLFPPMNEEMKLPERSYREMTDSPALSPIQTSGVAPATPLITVITKNDTARDARRLFRSIMNAFVCPQKTFR